MLSEICYYLFIFVCCVIAIFGLHAAWQMIKLKEEMRAFNNIINKKEN